MAQINAIGTNPLPDSSLSGDIVNSFSGNSGTATPSSKVINIIGSGGVTTLGSGNTITISGKDSLAWQTITANQALSVSNGYFCISPGGALSLSLPAASVIGDEIQIILDGATSFTVTQGAGQSIRLGNAVTTTGVSGSLSSTQQGDCIRLICQTTNLKWNVISVEGNLTIV